MSGTRSLSLKGTIRWEMPPDTSMHQNCMNVQLERPKRAGGPEKASQTGHT